MCVVESTGNGKEYRSELVVSWCAAAKKLGYVVQPKSGVYGAYTIANMGICMFVGCVVSGNVVGVG